MNTSIATPQAFRSMISKKKEDIKDILPSHISVDKFQQAATTAAAINPDILRCDRTSVMASLMRCAAAGLVPDGNEAALVPFKSRATYMPMIFGIIKMLRQSGEVKSVWAEIVYEGEDLAVEVVEGERIPTHIFDPLERGGPAIKGVYAVAKMADGTTDMEVMPVAEIEKRRKASANQKGDKATGIWQQWYPEMAKKTVIRALAKRLPISTEDNRRIQQVEGDETPVDVTPPKTLTERLQEAQEPKTPEEPEEAVVDAEIVSDVVFDEDAVDMASDAYSEGAKASIDGQSEMDNHYPDNPEFSSWLGGFRKAIEAGA